MRNLVLFISLVLLFGFFSILSAQDVEMLRGGNMEDESAWNVHHLTSVDIAEYEFNYAGADLAFGSGGALNVYASISESSDILFWQEVTLKGGATYTFSGAFKDLTGGNLLNFWCEVLLSTEVPPDSEDVDYGGGTPLCAFNTWDGCGPDIDGTFQDDFCKGGGPVFTVPDSLGDEVTYYFSVNVGIWGGGVAFDYDVLIDDLSLMGPAVTSVEENEPTVVEDFKLHDNYPNPFNPSTTLSYSLQQTGTVSLVVYDLLGEEVARLIDNKVQNAGEHSVVFDASDLPSGVYYYKLQSGLSATTKKMLFLK